jgi:Flp pilus assembly protein TadB
MRRSLLDAPWWVLGLLQGTLFGVFMAVFSYATGDRDVPSMLVGASVGALVFGIVIGRLTARHARRDRAEAGDLRPHELRTARRAAGRGAVPKDPRIRQVALRIVEHRTRTVVRQRRWAVPMFAVLIVLSLVLAIDSRWWLLATAVYALGLAGQWFSPWWLRRRGALLAAVTAS